MKALQRSCEECDAEQIDYLFANTFRHEKSCKTRPTPTRRIIEACPDCGEEGERIGHQGCQYPQDH